MLHDRVLVSMEGRGGERLGGGIVIPASVGKRLAWATVVATGANVRQVKIGDRVLFDPEDRAEVELQSREYVLLRERDIHAVAAASKTSTGPTSTTAGYLARPPHAYAARPAPRHTLSGGRHARLAPGAEATHHIGRAPIPSAPGHLQPVTRCSSSASTMIRRSRGRWGAAPRAVGRVATEHVPLDDERSQRRGRPHPRRRAARQSDVDEHCPLAVPGTPPGR